MIDSIYTRFLTRLGFAFLLVMAISAQSRAAEMPASCDNKGFLAVQRTYENNAYLPKAYVPVHICGKVLALSKKSRHTRSGEHGYFYVYVGEGVSIRIVSNLDAMLNDPLWPWLQKGDYVEVAGRYYYDNPRRQGIDWTHKNISRKWPFSGYVMVNGNKYE